MKSGNLLLIDIGNTNLKWALLQGGRLAPARAEPHRAVAVGDLAARCWSRTPPPDAIYLANVAGVELESGLADWMQAQWDRSPRMVRSVARACGVINGYDDPAQLGVDRWLTLLAVRRQERGAVCVVDCGTAITVDLLDGGGQHHGGVILPGLDLMREALLQQTRIPRVDPVSIDTLFARDTASGVASAAVHAAAALIERAVRQAGADVNESPKLILTGSDAGRIAAQIDIPWQLDHELVMKGLVAIAQEAG